jgi:hypothetical protein
MLRTLVGSVGGQRETRSEPESGQGLHISHVFQGSRGVWEDHLRMMLNKVLWQLLVLSLGMLGGPVLRPVPIYRISEFVAKT